MLKGIDRRISPELLRDLSAMGHLETILVADSNFPVGRLSCPVHYLATDTLGALAAISSLVPLETNDPDCVVIRVDPAAIAPNELQARALELLQAEEPGLDRLAAPPLADFVLAATAVSAAIITVDVYPSCFVLKRGVVLEPG